MHSAGTPQARELAQVGLLYRHSQDSAWYEVDTTSTKVLDRSGKRILKVHVRSREAVDADELSLDDVQKRICQQPDPIDRGTCHRIQPGTLLLALDVSSLQHARYVDATVLERVGHPAPCVPGSCRCCFLVQCISRRPGPTIDSPHLSGSTHPILHTAQTLRWPGANPSTHPLLQQWRNQLTRTTTPSGNHAPSNPTRTTPQLITAPATSAPPTATRALATSAPSKPPKSPSSPRHPSASSSPTSSTTTATISDHPTRSRSKRSRTWEESSPAIDAPTSPSRPPGYKSPFQPYRNPTSRPSTPSAQHSHPTGTSPTNPAAAIPPAPSHGSNTEPAQPPPALQPSHSTHPSPSTLSNNPLPLQNPADRHPSGWVDGVTLQADEIEQIARLAYTGGLRLSATSRHSLAQTVLAAAARQDAEITQAQAAAIASQLIITAPELGGAQPPRPPARPPAASAHSHHSLSRPPLPNARPRIEGTTPVPTSYPIAPRTAQHPFPFHHDHSSAFKPNLPTAATTTTTATDSQPPSQPSASTSDSEDVFQNPPNPSASPSRIIAAFQSSGAVQSIQCHPSPDASPIPHAPSDPSDPLHPLASVPATRPLRPIPIRAASLTTRSGTPTPTTSPRSSPFHRLTSDPDLIFNLSHGLRNLLPQYQDPHAPGGPSPAPVPGQASPRHATIPTTTPNPSTNPRMVLLQPPPEPHYTSYPMHVTAIPTQLPYPVAAFPAPYPSYPPRTATPRDPRAAAAAAPTPIAAATAAAPVPVARPAAYTLGNLERLKDLLLDVHRNQECLEAISLPREPSKAFTTQQWEVLHHQMYLSHELALVLLREAAAACKDTTTRQDPPPSATTNSPSPVGDASDSPDDSSPRPPPIPALDDPKAATRYTVPMVTTKLPPAVPPPVAQDDNWAPEDDTEYDDAPPSPPANYDSDPPAPQMPFTSLATHTALNPTPQPPTPALANPDASAAPSNNPLTNKRASPTPSAGGAKRVRRTATPTDAPGPAAKPAASGGAGPTARGKSTTPRRANSRGGGRGGGRKEAHATADAVQGLLQLAESFPVTA